MPHLSPTHKAHVEVSGGDDCSDDDESVDYEDDDDDDGDADVDDDNGDDGDADGDDGGDDDGRCVLFDGLRTTIDA